MKCGIVGLPNVGKSTLFNALTKAGIAAENYPFCTIEPNVGIVEVPDPRLPSRWPSIAKPEKVHARGRRVRRHRRAGGGRVQGRRARQPVSRQHPRDRRHRQHGALLRGRQRGARRGQGRSGLRHRDHPHRTGAGRPGDGGKGDAARRQDRQGRRQGSDHAGRVAGKSARAARSGQAGARAEAREGGAAAAEAAVPDDGQAGDVRRQRRRKGL